MFVVFSPAGCTYDRDIISRDRSCRERHGHTLCSWEVTFDTDLSQLLGSLWEH